MLYYWCEWNTFLFIIHTCSDTGVCMRIAWNIMYDESVVSRRSITQINTRAACIRPLGDMFALFTTIFIYLYAALCICGTRSSMSSASRAFLRLCMINLQRSLSHYCRQRVFCIWGKCFPLERVLASGFRPVSSSIMQSILYAASHTHLHLSLTLHICAAGELRISLLRWCCVASVMKCWVREKQRPCASMCFCAGVSLRSYSHYVLVQCVYYHISEGCRRQNITSHLRTRPVRPTLALCNIQRVRARVFHEMGNLLYFRRG